MANAELAVTILGAQTGFQNLVTQSDPVSQINNIGQLAAGLASLVGNPQAILASNTAAAMVTLGKMDLDVRNGKYPAIDDVMSIAGNLVSMAAVAAVTLTPTGRAAGILMKAAIAIGGTQVFGYVISNSTASTFNAAQLWAPRRDPLTFDLDGDGLETVALSPTNPVLFDHDGDGLKNGTGWVSPDDGFLVLDRNGNGTIDSGRELFGDSTPLAAGGNAIDGFAALAQEDTNGDGKVNASDARFAQLRMWRDLNQDGISQAGELFTLASLNIASINVAKTANNQLLPGGNRIADLGTYTRTDGTTGGLGDVAQLGDVDLAVDTFHRQYTTPIPLVEGVTALPNMQGSGRVRDLWEAASQSPTLKNLLTQYTQSTSRADQRAILDSLLIEWGKTSDLPDTISTLSLGTDTSGRTAQDVVNAWKTSSPDAYNRLVTLERFNGTPIIPRLTQLVWSSAYDPRIPGWVSTSYWRFGPSGEQGSLLDDSWTALHDSVYDSIAMQTRFKAILDEVNLTLQDGAFVLDFTAVKTDLQNRINQDPILGIADLYEFTRATKSLFQDTGWKKQGYELLATNLSRLTMTPALQGLINELHYPIEGQAGFSPSGTAGDDIVIGADQGSTLSAGAGDDLLFGEGGNDTLNGNSGDDILDGGAGNDTLNGDAGNDTYLFGRGAGQDSINNYAYSSSYTAGKTDAILMGAGVLPSEVSLTRTSNNLVVSINGTTDTLTVKEYFYFGDYTLEQIKFADGTIWDIAAVKQRTITNGTLGNDSIVGYSGGPNTIYGLEGADLINGGDGNDFIDGGVGVDTLSGAAGNDVLNGAADNDTLNGNGGDDMLDGGAGNDQMYGGTGDDTYTVDSAGDIVTENLNQGIDTVQTSVTYTLGNNVENLTLTGTAVVNGTGNALNNSLLGNSANNILDGGAGDDTFNGGAGSDTLKGGVGNDVFIVDTTTDVITENLNEGTDTVQSSVTLTLGNNLENLVLTGTTAINGTGNTHNNTLTGNGANNILNGGAGADILIGGAGNDTYVIDNVTDTVTENANEGTDLVQSSVTYTLAANVENLTLTGTTAINATGNSLANTLTGNAAINVLTGGAGNDIYVASAGDTTIENANEGIDTVQTGVTWALASNLDNLTLTGTAAINGTGNELNNVLTGNSANNILDGSAGDDTVNGGAGIDALNGGLGNDIFIVDTITDVITENLNEGIDTVQSSVAYTLGANLENLTLTGTTVINGTGNELNNVLTGNSVNNILDGGAGDDMFNGGAGIDTLKGGLGNDTYTIDTATDVVTENLNEGIDTVQSSVAYTLGANLDNLILTGTAAINGAGNTLNNLVRGNAGVNTLTGSTGVDILEGGAGNDILTDSGGNGLYNGGAGTDTLTGSASNELFIGGAGNDTITTGTGADLIGFNRGDGQDIVNASTGVDNSISLGGGIKYTDLNFKKNLNDLILDVGATEQITLKDWYLGTTNKSVLNLQMIAEAMADFNATGGDPLRDNKVETFNFGGLVDRFDQARTANPALTSWALTNALLDFHTGNSDTAALGGDLAYQYGKNGNLSNVSFTPAQGILGSAGFGTAAQTLQPVASLQDTTPRLG